MPKSVLLMFTVVLCLLAAGCPPRKAQKPRDYETVSKDPRRDTDAARLHNARAVKLLQKGEMAKAEKELKEALAADVFFAPAHNNLGTVYYRQGKHYLAAWEYQYAAKLMPDSPRPKSNLGLVLEAVGKYDEAVGAYEQALELAPDNV